MTLSWLLWVASLLPQHTGDQLCLASTIYLEARNQSLDGQRAVAEVALRRLDSGRWGDSLSEVVTAPKQFAPTLVSPNYRFRNLKAWRRSVAVAIEAESNWSKPLAQRQQLVPGADHFVVLNIASPTWAKGKPIATIGDHTFYRVSHL